MFEDVSIRFEKSLIFFEFKSFKKNEEYTLLSYHNSMIRENDSYANYGWEIKISSCLNPALTFFENVRNHFQCKFKESHCDNFGFFFFFENN